jgi:hypothetical protein
MVPDHTVVAPVRPEQALPEGELDADALRGWIILDRDVLVDLRNDAIDGTELAQHLKRI